MGAGQGQNCGVPVKEVYEIQLNNDTRKANALVAGLGQNRRIFVGDTLLNSCSGEEIEAVFAHEAGHVRLCHTWIILGFGTLISLASFYLASLLFGRSLGMFGFGEIYDLAALPLLGLILMAVAVLFMPIQNGFMRYLEKQADMFATSHISDGRSFRSAITKLSNQNLSDPSPSRLVEIFLYTHPPLSKRLGYLITQNNESRETQK